MRRSLAIAFGALAACASGGSDTASVPFCAPLATLAPRPDGCAPGELDAITAALSERVLDDAGSALVRVELDDAARVRAVCVEEGPGFGERGARRSLSEHLDAIRAAPAGPACAAGKRLDLNRYAAADAEVRERMNRCQEQNRITRETHGNTTIRDRTVPGRYGVFDNEIAECMEHDADWIVLDVPGSTRPWIYVKPEVADAPGLSASDTASRCRRESQRAEKQAACIESEGWERLEPPRR